MKKLTDIYLKKCIFIASLSVIPVFLTHLVYQTNFEYDDAIRLTCMLFTVFCLPIILFRCYKKMMGKDKRINIFLFLLMFFQLLATLLLLDGEGAMLYEELDGGEGMQIAVCMIVVAYVILGICILIDGINTISRRK